MKKLPKKPITFDVAFAQKDENDIAISPTVTP